MENIKIENIWKRNFEDSKMLEVEERTRKYTCSNTEECINKYNNLEQSRNGNYISSDLMKLVFDEYANNIEYRKKYNLAVANSAACLANLAYRTKIKESDADYCIFVAGPFGSGKSFLIQSLYEEKKEELKNCIMYEGSITTKTIDEKIDFAIKSGKIPCIIVLNPTLELSMQNIKDRVKRIGRDVRKEDCVYVYANIYGALKRLIEKYSNLSYTIYNKTSNIPSNLETSHNIEDLNHGSYEEVAEQYDTIISSLK